MPRLYINILIALSVFLSYSCSYLSLSSAQEKQEAREEAKQEQTGSRARTEEPAEFQGAQPIIIPPEIELMEQVQKGVSSQKAEPLITSSTQQIEFMERVLKQQEKILATSPSKKAEEEKEKLTRKKKEEKKEKKETGAAKPAAEEGPLPERELEEREYYIDIGDTLDISVWELPLPKERLVRGETEKEEPEEYYIDIGDVLDISVWQVPDLSRPEVIVRPDGRISYPLVGDIKVKGFNLTQLDDAITEKLKAYVKNPEVSVMVRRLPGGEIGKVTLRSDLSRSDIIVRPDGKVPYPLIGDINAEGLTFTQLDDVITEKLKSYLKYPEVSIMMRKFGEQTNKVVMLGEIGGPGVYRFSAPPTIIEAVASAGGYTKYAVLNSIMIIRGDVRGKPEVIRVNVAQIIKAGRLAQNISLRPNDIVYVPRSFIGNINTFLEIIQPAISEYMQTMNARHFQHILHRNR